MDLFIITGTTKGLGHALAQQVLAEGHFVLSISRESSIKHPHFLNIKHDLAKPQGLEVKILKAKEKLKSVLKKSSTLHLINNAAVIAPIGSAVKFSLDDIQKHMQVNLVAPIYLTSLVLKIFKSTKLMRTFTNISSGAAYHGIPSWSLYCSSKAGLKMFTENMNVDFADSLLRFLDFSPGVMDTQMQATIRKQTEDNFPLVGDFKKYKSEGTLRSPEDVAAKLLKVLSQPGKIDKMFYDVKEL